MDRLLQFVGSRFQTRQTAFLFGQEQLHFFILRSQTTEFILHTIRFGGPFFATLRMFLLSGLELPVDRQLVPVTANV